MVAGATIWNHQAVEVGVMNIHSNVFQPDFEFAVVDTTILVQIKITVASKHQSPPHDK
jgi:hypothetical protein